MNCQPLCFKVIDLQSCTHTLINYWIGFLYSFFMDIMQRKTTGKSEKSIIEEIKVKKTTVKEFELGTIE